MRTPIRAVVVLLAMLAATIGVHATPAAGDPLDGLTGDGWSVKSVTMDSGRSYFAMTPNCRDVCTTERQLVIFNHAAGGLEDLLTATVRLKRLHEADPDAIFVFSVSEGGTKRFDAGVDYCCTWEDTNEVQYLIDVVDSVSARTPVDRDRVGLMGQSNGGMLSERAICVRPDVFSAAAVWAGTWDTQLEGCQNGVVNVKQWHGDEDDTVPLHGGCRMIWGHEVCMPPADEFGSQILPESRFVLEVLEGVGHAAPSSLQATMVGWLDRQL